MPSDAVVICVTDHLRRRRSSRRNSVAHRYANCLSRRSFRPHRPIRGWMQRRDNRVAGMTDQAYFEWAKPVEEFTGWAEAPKFTPWLSSTDNVIDFGCGAGYFLRYLLEQGACAQGVGVDISEAARDEARRQGITVHASAAAIPDGWADAIISTSALEHCQHPLLELQALYPKLRPGGRIIFRVPCEHIGYRYEAGDINHHLYSWGPMTAGNLFTDAGFEIETIRTDMQKWPPRGYQLLRRIGGRRGFDLVAGIYGRLRRSWFYVIVVARRPAVG